MKKMNKKGFEMSIGLIVLIILSIVIFSLSLYFIFKWFGSAEELKAEIDRQTGEQITAALKTGNQLVAIPVAVQQAKRGKSASFGLGVRNIAAEKRFSMALDFSGAYYPDGMEIPVDAMYMNERWLGGFATADIGLLKRNEQRVVPFLIKADLNVAPGVPAPMGDYVFNVCVYDKPLTVAAEPPARCSIGQFKINSEAFYTSKIYQVTVKLV